jgi:hypothetical protein
MESLKYWFRWISVLPGAIIFALLSTFPLHWLLYLAYAKNGTLFGIIELPRGANNTIEYFLYPALIAAVFVYSSYKIAPKHKFKVALIFFIIYVLSWSIVSFIALFNGSINNLTLQFSGRTILALAGAFFGLFEARRESKEIKS